MTWKHDVAGSSVYGVEINKRTDLPYKRLITPTFFFFLWSKREQIKISGGTDAITSLFLKVLDWKTWPHNLKRRMWFWKLSNRQVVYNLTDKWFSFAIKGNSKPTIIQRTSTQSSAFKMSPSSWFQEMEAQNLGKLHWQGPGYTGTCSSGFTSFMD